VIARELLFGNPERTEPKLSPDGKAMSWLAPDARGVQQVWVGTRNTDECRCVTADRSRGISFYGWTWDSKKIVYIQDSEGDENYHMFAVDLETGNVRDLTPWQGITASFVASSRKHPDYLLVALNVRDRTKHDVRQINIETGEARLDTENPGDVGGWIADDEMVVRAATPYHRKAHTRLGSAITPVPLWRTVARPGAEDEIHPIGFDQDGGELRLKSSIGNDTVRLMAKDLKTGAEREVARQREAGCRDCYGASDHASNRGGCFRTRTPPVAGDRSGARGRLRCDRQNRRRRFFDWQPRRR